MSNAHLFVIASRKAYRFNSVRGPLNVEQLWQLPLSAKDQFDLNNVAKTAKSELTALTDADDFVGKSTVNAVEAQHADNKLEIVKTIIAERKAEAEAAASASEKAARRRQLLDLLERKETAALEQLTSEEIRKQLEDLQ